MSREMLRSSSAKTVSVPKRVTIALSLVVLLLLAGALYRGHYQSDDSQVADSIIQDECMSKSSLSKKKITIDDEDLVAELAILESDQAQGLSGRDCLSQGRGMLFVYDSPDRRCFWMKDMMFSIDMVWLDEDRRIVDIDHEVNPDTYPDKTFCKDNIQYVLEVSGGHSNASGWSEGQQFTW